MAVLAVAGCRTQDTHGTLACDVSIVGSGFAGIYLAQRLVDRGLRVIVLEAGAHLARTAPADGATSLFPARSIGSYAFPIDATRTIAVGGTSRKWNGVVSRLLPSDLRMHSVRGLDVDWPIDYAAGAAGAPRSWGRRRRSSICGDSSMGRGVLRARCAPASRCSHSIGRRR